MGWMELNEGLGYSPLKVGNFLDAFLRLTIGDHSTASLASAGGRLLRGSLKVLPQVRSTPDKSIRENCPAKR